MWLSMQKKKMPLKCSLTAQNVFSGKLLNCMFGEALQICRNENEVSPG